MFNVDITVKNNRTSLFRQLISRHLWKQVTLAILTLLYLTPRIYFLKTKWPFSTGKKNKISTLGP